MKFNPLTEEELSTSMLLPEGVYSYRVFHAEDKVSSKGNEYTSLILRIMNNEGREQEVFTNLALIKLAKHFCDVNGLQDQYNSGDLPCGYCMDKSGGKVVIGIEGEKPNPNGGMYKAKNIVKDYIVDPKGSMTMPLAGNDFVDSDLPF